MFVGKKMFEEKRDVYLQRNKIFAEKKKYSREGKTCRGKNIAEKGSQRINKKCKGKFMD